MKVSRSVFIKVVLVLSIGIFSSCASVYKLGGVKTRYMSDSRIYRNLIDSSLNFSSVYIKKYNASYTLKDKKQSFKGSIKIQKDSAIIISMASVVGGIEGARILITPDSVKMINRLKKEYFIGSNDSISKRIGFDLDFNTLQGILTNSLFEIKKKDKKSFIRNFKGKVLGDKYIFISNRERKISRKLRKDKDDKLSKFNYQRFDIDPSLFRITDMLVKQFEEGRVLQIAYSEFRDFGTSKMPSVISLTASDPKGEVNCKIRYSRISVNEKISFRFKISSKYKRVYP